MQTRNDKSALKTSAPGWMFGLCRKSIRVVAIFASVAIAPICGSDYAMGRTPARANSIALQSPIALEDHPLLPLFKSRDVDEDGELTEAEFVGAGSPDAKQRTRELLAFDADRNGRLSLAEFVTIPMGQTEEQRGVISDPVILLAQARLEEIMKAWEKASGNVDEPLTKPAFESAKLASLVPGMKSLGFSVWDQNNDGLVTKDEAARTLEIAFGIRTPSGELLRDNTGRVVDWLTFRRLKIGPNGMVSKADYFEALGAAADKETWLKSIDKNRDGQFDYAEFATGDHRTEPVGMFLSLDKDLNGLLSQLELDALPDGWRQMAKFSFRGFDDDQDGSISLREYQLMPHCNLLAGWTEMVDKDHDGNLAPNEFVFIPGLPLAALTAEYFNRLDVDHNELLSLDEFQFSSRVQRPNVIYARLSDGSEVSISIPKYPIIYSPEVSPDGKWVAVDGWNNGQPSTAAHVLVASLETNEIRDLGVGCIPHWSADSQQIGFSRYGGGVWVRNVEDDTEPAELVDPRGWSIHFSSEGKKAAYVMNGNNFMIHDIASDEKHFVFSQGKSPYQYIEHNFTWSPDATRLCFRGHRSNGAIDVAIVSAIGEQPELKVLLDGKEAQSDFAWHPDGKRIMFPRVTPGSPRSQIYEVQADHEGPPKLFSPQPNDRNVIGISFSRDGNTSVFMTTNNGP